MERCCYKMKKKKIFNFQFISCIISVKEKDLLMQPVISGVAGATLGFHITSKDKFKYKKNRGKMR